MLLGVGEGIPLPNRVGQSPGQPWYHISPSTNEPESGPTSLVDDTVLDVLFDEDIAQLSPFVPKGRGIALAIPLRPLKMLGQRRGSARRMSKLGGIL